MRIHAWLSNRNEKMHPLVIVLKRSCVIFWVVPKNKNILVRARRMFHFIVAMMF